MSTLLRACYYQNYIEMYRFLMEKQNALRNDQVKYKFNYGNIKGTK